MFKPLVALVFLALIAGSFLPAPSSVNAVTLAQSDSPEAKATALLAKMTPEERVGQLFLVTLSGTDLRENSSIYKLIADQHIGGIVLSRENNNFDDQEDLVRQIYSLTTGLQQIEYQTSTASANSNLPSEYIPLFIGISQEGDRYSADQILSKVTALPSFMSLGATWNADLAYQTGYAMGNELSALGFNLFLGPSLDVVDGFFREGSEDLGTRTFGGDPYWVSRMGQAYIAGLHAGSTPENSTDVSAASQVAVIAKHFPGMGSSDRNPQTEIPTVRKSLDQLNRIELAPFYSVTGGSAQPEAITDGLYLSHIRYQGFQGNIRDISTRPISFDQSALNEILKLEPLTQWRENGGLLVSDNLGSPALRRFFDPSGNNFDARQVARNALMAGNDLLYADGLISSSDSDTFTTLSRTIEFFTKTYLEDAAFADRVDASVERILALKYQLYPEFNAEKVLPVEEGLSAVGINSAITNEVTASSATLISPDAAELVNILPRPPASNERIVFITDELPVTQCTTCAVKPSVPVDALQEAVLRIYGTRTGGPISRNLLQSYSFFDLQKLFSQQTEPPPIEESLRLANWVVVAVQNNDPDRPESLAFEQLLSERPDLLRNKRVVVFALNAPYYLDATDISKLSAYYGLYAKSDPFIELAARILFQEHIPSGASPVSIPGTGYDLAEITRPDPDQIIALNLDTPEIPVGQDQPTPVSTPVSTPVPSFNIGDTLQLRTSVILDHNQNPVPDSTVVRFHFSQGNEPGLTQIIETQTVDGIGRASYKIERSGLLEITASSDPAFNSTRMILDITDDSSAVITVIAPTAQPSQTPTATSTLTPTVTPSPTPLPLPPPKTDMRDWVIALLLSLGAAVLVTWLAGNIVATRWALRLGLCTMVGALLGFNYLALDFPGSQEILIQFKVGSALLLGLTGALVGLIAGWVWRWIAMRQHAGGPPTPNRAVNPPMDPPLNTPEHLRQQPPGQN